MVRDVKNQIGQWHQGARIMLQGMQYLKRVISKGFPTYEMAKKRYEI